MSKKLAEEAIEVVIDAVNGEPDAVVRESADLIYNLTVLWVSCGVEPATSGARWIAAKKLLGIAEKLPKSAVERAAGIAVAMARRNCRARGPTSSAPPTEARRKFSAFPAWTNRFRDDGGSRSAMLRRIYDWCIAAADKPYALWILTAVSFAESSFFPVPPDVMLIPMSLAPRPDRRPRAGYG